VEVKRISQDGTKVRASAGTRSYRRRPRLEKLLADISWMTSGPQPSRATPEQSTA